MSDATSMAEAFASGRSDPVQVLEQASGHEATGKTLHGGFSYL